MLQSFTHCEALQGDPEFGRLKRELEELKNPPRGLEGSFRTAAELERHRAHLADAALQEQLKAQAAFREHSARLQVRPKLIYLWDCVFVCDVRWNSTVHC